MKITLDIPDSTACMFVNFLARDNNDQLYMSSQSISTDMLGDGAEIKIELRVGE